jgi:hypothetical protein
MQSIDELFKGRHFEREIIILCALVFAVTAVRLSAEGGVDRLFVAKG